MSENVSCTKVIMSIETGTAPKGTGQSKRHCEARSG